MHQSYRLTSRLTNGWSQLSAYTVGVLSALPFVVLLHDDLEEVQDSSARLVYAYLLAYLAFGVGTVLGWLTCHIEGPQMLVSHED